MTSFLSEEIYISRSRYISRRNPAYRANDMKNLKSTESKRDVMKNLGCLGFDDFYIKNLHVDSQLSSDLIKDSILFHWTHEQKNLFLSIKDMISEDTIVVVPTTDFLFHIQVHLTIVGASYVVIQQLPEGK